VLYENVFILSGQLTEKSATEKFDQFKKVIEESGGKILKKEFWGLRDLAYKIKKNSKGYYYMINTDCKPEVLNGFHVKLKQDENFLRFLNFKIKVLNKEDSSLVDSKKNDN